LPVLVKIEEVLLPPVHQDE